MPETSRAFRSSGSAVHALVILMLATFTALLDRYLIGLLLDPIRADFGISDTQASLLQGFAFAIFYSVLGLPFGRLVDRGNRRNIIIFGIVIWSLTTIACGFAQSYTSLFFARLGVGFGEACLAPAAYSLITDLFPPKRHARALAWYTAASIVGGGGSFIIGAEALHFAKRLATEHAGFTGTEPWRLTFMIVGAPGLAVALLMLSFREPARQALGAQSDLPSWRELGAFMFRIRWPLFAIIGAGSAMTIAGSGVVGWLAVFLMRTYHVPVTTGGQWIGLILIGSAILGGTLSGWLGDSKRIGSMQGQKFNVILIGSAAAALLVVAFPLMPSAVLALSVYALQAIAYNVAACAAPTVLQDILPNRFKGQVGAFYWLCVGLIGFGGGSTIVALVTDRVLGDELALRYSLAIVGSIAMIAACLCVILGRRTYQRLRDEISVAGGA